MAGEPIVVGLTHSPNEPSLVPRVAEAGRAAGLAVAGMIQLDEVLANRRRCAMTLLDLRSGRRIPISQDRGDAAQGCRLDHYGLEDAAGAVLADLRGESLPDLVVLSKFGKREIEGHGFRQVVECAVEAGVPLMVGVGPDHVEGFRAFGGGFERLIGTLAEAERLIAEIAAGRRSSAA